MRYLIGLICVTICIHLIPSLQSSLSEQLTSTVSVSQFRPTYLMLGLHKSIVWGIEHQLLSLNDLFIISIISVVMFLTICWIPINYIHLLSETIQRNCHSMVSRVSMVTSYLACLLIHFSVSLHVVNDVKHKFILGDKNVSSLLLMMVEGLLGWPTIAFLYTWTFIQSSRRLGLIENLVEASQNSPSTTESNYLKDILSNLYTLLGLLLFILVSIP
jgi:hypothetical protein